MTELRKCLARSPVMGCTALDVSVGLRGRNGITLAGECVRRSSQCSNGIVAYRVALQLLKRGLGIILIQM